MMFWRGKEGDLERFDFQGSPPPSIMIPRQPLPADPIKLLGRRYVRGAVEIVVYLREGEELTRDDLRRIQELS